MLELSLPTMTCGHCVKAVTAAVQAVDPQAQVQCDLAAHTVNIASSADPATLRAAVVEAGYEPA
jgi:copper chaperone